MKAAVYHSFGGEILIEDIKDPNPSAHGLVIEVKSTGICRSDWYGWQGNDPDITLPHVPGHELAGEVMAVGRDVSKWKVGDRVTLPFVGGCGHCPECISGNHQVCDNQFQPGFTANGSFAQYVAIDYADINVVRLPDHIDYEEAASMGCRFITAFRGVVDLGEVNEGDWVAVHGCGGVGLSAIMIAKALKANVIAVDINEEALDMAVICGADYTINAHRAGKVPDAVRDIHKRGVHVSIDALGNKEVVIDSIQSLAKRGRHIQIGLLEKGENKVEIPMDKIIAHELKILGSHGMQAYRYPEIFKMWDQGLINPGKMITDIVDLEAGIKLMTEMESNPPKGVAIINRFN